MDNTVKDTKKRNCSEAFYKCSSILSAVAILLTFTLFFRIETVARDSKMMDSKFTLQIQQIQDALSERASAPEKEDFDISNGR